MACDLYAELIPLHAAGQLDARDRRSLDAHLAVCPSCRSSMADWRRIRSAVRDHAQRRALDPPMLVPPRRWSFGQGARAGLSVLLVIGMALLWRAVQSGPDAAGRDADRAGDSEASIASRPMTEGDRPAAPSLADDVAASLLSPVLRLTPIAMKTPAVAASESRAVDDRPGTGPEGAVLGRGRLAAALPPGSPEPESPAALAPAALETPGATATNAASPPPSPEDAETPDEPEPSPEVTVEPGEPETPEMPTPTAVEPTTAPEPSPSSIPPTESAWPPAGSHIHGEIRYRGQPRNEIPLVLRAASGGEERWRGVTESGRFALSLPEPELILSVESAQHRLRFWAGDGAWTALPYLAWSLPLADPPLRADLELSDLPDSALEGRVLDSEGSGRSGALIVAVPEDARAVADWGPGAISDEGGAFRLHVEPGRYRIGAAARVSRSAYPEIWFGGETSLDRAAIVEVVEGEIDGGMELYLP